MTVTIIDDDAPTVSFASDAVSVAENVASGMAQVTVRLSASPPAGGLGLTIPVMTTDGTARAGEDYTALSGATVVFAAGATGADLTQTVSVAILNETVAVAENDETFTVALGEPVVGVVSLGAPSSVTVTITDDDAPAVNFASNAVLVEEDAPSGMALVTLQLERSSGFHGDHTGDDGERHGDGRRGLHSPVRCDSDVYRRCHRR